MSRRVLLVDADLLALSRVEAATRASEAELITCSVGDLPEKLAHESFDLVIVDLDRGGEAALDALRVAGGLPARVIGFFSHVDNEMKTAAARAGVDAWPRGRLWRSLEKLLSPPEG